MKIIQCDRRTRKVLVNNNSLSSPPKGSGNILPRIIAIGSKYNSSRVMRPRVRVDRATPSRVPVLIRQRIAKAAPFRAAAGRSSPVGWPARLIIVLRITVMCLLCGLWRTSPSHPLPPALIFGRFQLLGTAERNLLRFFSHSHSPSLLLLH